MITVRMIITLPCTLSEFVIRHDMMVDRVTKEILMKLFKISIVARSLLGLDINAYIFLSTELPFLRSWISRGLNEKNATSEPETIPDKTSNNTNIKLFTR